jgi:hypothetical protein
MTDAPETPASQDAYDLSDRCDALECVNSLRASLARERESRKQAEAAAMRGDSMLSLLRHRAERSIPWGKDGLPGIWQVDEVIGQLRALSKPVQEPAERERGK